MSLCSRILNWAIRKLDKYNLVLSALVFMVLNASEDNRTASRMGVVRLNRYYMKHPINSLYFEVKPFENNVFIQKNCFRKVSPNYVDYLLDISEFLF